MTKLQQYDWFLFDADETLFSFDAFVGLQQMFAPYGVSFDAADYADYQALNQPLWEAYQAGQIDAEALQKQRFADWAARLEVAPLELNAAFIDTMAQVCQPLEGARALLERVAQQGKVGIVTNGFTALQHTRLEQTGFTDLIDLIVISEQVGVAKPDPKIFAHALAEMQHPAPERVLMTGDNPHSDVLGAQRSGIHACWLNQHALPCPLPTPPHYTVNSLPELEQLLLTPHE
ncbi:noncanonical pyrimidine nucleotidase, YjjG family [Pseudidiomarina sediminum]|uniref:Noncanonical pyrimidine nucleotidase, YjjG family n=1 Tax=Pseudidiomarina sediminum TaxID=431675 RepID=A0A432Z320_9GAMM|nr:pyrimidine 5'-nucleotidase [Pseudidiomarina sediminum]RUO72271.1 noncanonical pyrimidine nucleotidase, YjjG family [Pseudidiomarina sediminum]